MKLAAALAVAVVVGACGVAPYRAQKPVIISAKTVPPVVDTRIVERPADIPDELLVDCYDEQAKEISSEEAKRLAELRRKSIAECNRVKAKYRGKR